MSNSEIISLRYSCKFNLVKLLKNNVTSINPTILKKLLHSGININDSLTDDGRTPLHLSTQIRHEPTSLEAVRIILRHSANPNIPNKEGNTSLHLAACLGHRYVLQLLICNGGDILQCNIKGETSIDSAFHRGHNEVVSYLSKLLDTEEYKYVEGEYFIKFLWNRQLLEVTPDLKKSSVVTASCSFCKQNFIVKNSICNMSNESKDIFASTLQNETNFSSMIPSHKKESIFDHTENIKSDEDFKLFISHLENCYRSVEKDSFKNIPQTDEQLDEFLKNSFLNIGFYNTITDPSSIEELRGQEPYIDSNIESFRSFLSNSSCENYFTALTSLMSDSKSLTYLTVVEEYLYKDDDKGVELIERRYPGASTFSGTCNTAQSTTKSKKYKSSKYWSSEVSKLSHADSTVGTLTESIIGLSGEQLRMKLRDLGFNAGPITPSTFRALQRHFYKLRKNKINLTLKHSDSFRLTYSKELEKICLDPEIGMAHYEDLERKMCDPFITPNQSSCWRSGIHKTCFNYILLDPRVTRNLPFRRASQTTSELFTTFLSSVIYIGKGTRARPYSHFYEALSKKKKSMKSKRKIEKINEIWGDGLGVISLHLFQNTIPVEAWTREAAMIAALGTNNLCNSIQGTFYGPASTWRKKEQRQLGSLCLFKAFNVLLFEGERQIRPNDLSPNKWMQIE